jgi:hypothetical protein
MIWNLSTFEDLQPAVLSLVTGDGGARPRPDASTHGKSVMRAGWVAAGIAAVSIAVGFSGTASAGNSSAVAVASAAVRPVNNAQSESPLEGFFEGRFDQDWTRDEERRLLEKLARDRDPARRRRSADQVISAVHANLQEDIGDDIPRLSRDKVVSIGRRRSA